MLGQDLLQIHKMYTDGVIALTMLQSILSSTSIFARMTPEAKELLINLLKTSSCVSMCGDGSNDCLALKASDVGLSLSEAESSISAPFTSSHPSIAALLNLMREGRNALSKSVSAFKTVTLISVIEATAVALDYSIGSNLTEGQ